MEEADRGPSPGRSKMTAGRWVVADGPRVTTYAWGQGLPWWETQKVAEEAVGGLWVGWSKKAVGWWVVAEGQGVTNYAWGQPYF